MDAKKESYKASDLTSRGNSRVELSARENRSTASCGTACERWLCLEGGRGMLELLSSAGAVGSVDGE
jgi:hypothetical protein